MQKYFHFNFKFVCMLWLLTDTATVNQNYIKSYLAKNVPFIFNKIYFQAALIVFPPELSIKEF